MSIRHTLLPAKPWVRHKSFTKTIENWALPAPMTPIRITEPIDGPFRSVVA